MARPKKGMPVKTPAQRKETKRLWYLANRESILAHYETKTADRRECSKRWHLAHKDKRRADGITRSKTPAGLEAKEHSTFMRRFREHGLTLDEYHAMIEVQGFLCAICREEPSSTQGGSHDGFHIDHHHVSGKIRGLLCGICNVGIGMLKDSPEVCTAAATYLTSRHP